MDRTKLWEVLRDRMDPVIWMEGTQRVVVGNGDGFTHVEIG